MGAKAVTDVSSVLSFHGLDLDYNVGRELNQKNHQLHLNLLTEKRDEWMNQ